MNEENFPKPRAYVDRLVASRLTKNRKTLAAARKTIEDNFTYIEASLNEIEKTLEIPGVLPDPNEEFGFIPPTTDPRWGGGSFTVGDLIAALQQFDPTETVWTQSINRDDYSKSSMTGLGWVGRRMQGMFGSDEAHPVVMVSGLSPENLRRNIALHDKTYPYRQDGWCSYCSNCCELGKIEGSAGACERHLTEWESREAERNTRLHQQLEPS